MMKRLGAITAFGIIVAVAALSPTAQSGLTITAPASGVKLPAGPDYATDVLADPWDMSNPEDISPYPDQHTGWASNFGVSGGRVGGTTALTSSGAKDTSISFLYRGFYDVVNTGRTGRRYPLNSSFYKVVSYKMYSGASGELPHAIWFHNPIGGPNGTQNGVRFMPAMTIVGDQITRADLTQNLNSGQAWTSNTVKGLRLDPNTTKVGHQVFYDWVRVTRSDSETTAIQRIQWSGGSGSATIDIIDSGGTAFRAASGISDTFYDFNYGILPPGAYTIRVTRGSSTTTRPFSINNPPLVRVTDPDETGGEDFATQVLANPWDMDNSGTDVRSTANVSGISYSGGQFHGSNTNGDPIITVLNSSNNSTPINSSRYRYLTYTYKVDGAFNLNVTTGGSVARVYWSSSTSTPNATNTTTTEDIITWPGMNSYTVDLGSLQIGEDKGLESLGAMQPWTAQPIRHLRIDPHEFGLGTIRQFHYENIKLAAMDEASGSFVIRFAGTDADGDPSTVALYYDTNTNPNDGRSLITSGVPLSAGSFTWNTGNVSPGTYWIYALVSDALDQRGAYSTGQIRVNAGGSSNGDPMTVIEAPTVGASVASTFTMSGWAIDRDASSGSGVDYVQIHARPTGGTNQNLGNATRTTRNDIAQAYGSQFSLAGFTKSITLSPGTYTLTAMAHSTVTNSFDTKTVNVTVQSGASASNVQMAIEGPANGSSVGATFTVSGWAVDLASPTGTGVDAVALYRMPAGGGTTTYLGTATYGISKPSVGTQYGSRFTNSGYSKSISIPAGQWTIIVYAHSVVSNQWKSKTTTVSMNSALTVAEPVRLEISSPSPNAQVNGTFTVSGSAVDLRAASGTGVDSVAIYRMPVSGGSATLIGLATYGLTRNDIASLYGNQFRDSGYSRSISLSPGGHTIVVFAHSTVTGDWTSKTVTVDVD